VSDAVVGRPHDLMPRLTSQPILIAAGRAQRRPMYPLYASFLFLAKVSRYVDNNSYVSCTVVSHLRYMGFEVVWSKRSQPVLLHGCPMNMPFIVGRHC